MLRGKTDPIRVYCLATIACDTGNSGVAPVSLASCSSPLIGAKSACGLYTHPKILEAEGAFTAYKCGKSVDAWLVTPADKKVKISFRKKLPSREDEFPNKDQLGELTEVEFEAA